VNDKFDGSPLRPRSGATLRILIIARSLDDQVALCEGYVRGRHRVPIVTRVIKGRGSGELLNRKDLADAEAAVESAAFDLVVVEDIGRICRRNRAVDFCELCVTRGPA
jgi:site-specific DNA recombinase